MVKLKQILIAVITLSFASLTLAADPATVNQYTEQFMTDLQAKVTLTADQQAAMDEVLTNGMTTREDVLESYQGQKGLKVKRSIRDELKSVNATMQSEAQEILDAEQYQAFLDVQKENQEKVRERINANH